VPVAEAAQHPDLGRAVVAVCGRRDEAEAAALAVASELELEAAAVPRRVGDRQRRAQALGAQAREHEAGALAIGGDLVLEDGPGPGDDL